MLAPRDPAASAGWCQWCCHRWVLRRRCGSWGAAAAAAASRWRCLVRGTRQKEGGGSLSGFQCTQLSVLWTKWGMLGECWESAGRVRGTRGEHAGNIRGNAQGTCAEQAESCVAAPWNAKGIIQEHSRKQNTLGTQEHRSILRVDGHDGSCPCLAGNVRGSFTYLRIHSRRGAVPAAATADPAPSPAGLQESSGNIRA